MRRCVGLRLEGSPVRLVLEAPLRPPVRHQWTVFCLTSAAHVPLQVDGDDSEEEDETMGDIDVEAAPALAISDDASAAKSEKKN
jgi:hypothetical protein